MGMGCQRKAPGVLPPEILGTYCVGGWVDIRVGLDGCGKPRTHRDLIPGPSSL